MTTVLPSSGEVSQIDVGGDGSWLPQTLGGYAQVGGLSGSSPTNPDRGFVFPLNLGGFNSTADIARSSRMSPVTISAVRAGPVVRTGPAWNFNPGPGDGTGPIDGNPYSDARSLWWYGISDMSPTFYQNDFTTIASNTNVGFRAPSGGRSIATAVPLTVAGNQVSASGVIVQISDVDYFSFATVPVRSDSPSATCLTR